MMNESLGHKKCRPRFFFVAVVKPHTFQHPGHKTLHLTNTLTGGQQEY